VSDELSNRVPSGYRFASCYAGIRKKQADDLTLILSDQPASAAGMFTTNVVRAAPVTVTAEHLRKSGGVCRAILANAGNANCATPTMEKVARASARAAASLFGTRREEILLASTGVIGEPLDERRITQALPVLQERLSPENFGASARAIMTTDTVAKTAYTSFETRDGVVRLAGMAKGAGMIHPNMATMLAFLFTDAEIGPRPLGKMLGAAVETSFNRISVDGDTSTNDTVYLLANGASGVRLRKKDLPAFETALEEITQQLAIAIVRDGEGARRLLTIEVDGAPDDAAAERIARAIANSPLVKTALAGADPNWGRILSSAGACGVAFDPAKVDIDLNGHRVCRRGMRAKFSEFDVQATMDKPESSLLFRIRGDGNGKAKFWTCDLTEEYIAINAEYRT
jgi:glutamate N-acetyltransferase / amino-acid N-acetyltransferase